MTNEAKPSLEETLISVLQSKKAGLRTTALVAQVMASDAMFNSRVADLKASKRPFNAERFLELLDVYEDLCEQCRVAGKDFVIAMRADEFGRVLTHVQQQLDREPMLTLKLE